MTASTSRCEIGRFCGLACGSIGTVPKRLNSSRSLIFGTLLPLCPGLLSKQRGEAGAEAEEAAEAGGFILRGALANAEQFGGDAHGFAEEIGVDAVGLSEGVEAGEIFLQLLIREGDLILLRLAGVGLCLLASELRGQVAKASGVVRGSR